MKEQDVKNIIETITGTIKVELGGKWGEAKDFAESETKKYVQNIDEIILWKEAGKVTEEQAVVLMRMHKRSMKMVLTALEGISLVLAEKAINAAIDAIAKFVNGLIGWDIL